MASDPARKDSTPEAIKRASTKFPSSIDELSPSPSRRQRSDLLLFIVVFTMALGLTGLLSLAGVAVGFSVVLAVLAALILLVLIARWPLVGFFAVVLCVTLIEQSPLETGVGTDQLYIFYWPSGLTGLPERPIGFLILFIFFVLVCQQLLKRRWTLRGGELLLPFLLFLLCVGIGVVHGLTSGGQFKIMILEIRPLWYMFVSYLLAYNLVTHRNHIRLFFWVVILDAGVKSLQGVYLYLIAYHGDLVNHHEIMSHEESFFFVALILLVLLFSIHHRYWPQFITALLIMPFLLIATIANQRRTDFVALLIGAAVVCVLVFLIKPKIRVRLSIWVVIFAALGAAYVAAFAHAGGAFAEPARSVVSVFSPSTSSADYYSNLYRLIENFDLKATIRTSPLIGYGFGKPFLQPVPLPVLATSDPTFNGNPYLYIPHNTIYWIWMRLGALGYFALWYLFGSVVIRGCHIVRKLKDPYLQMMAIYIVAIMFMEVIVAYADYQLFFYRNVIYLGLLIGILLRLPALDSQKEQPVYETAHDMR